MKLKDLTGLKFNKLTVIQRAASKRGGSSSSWLCRCDCGQEKVYSSDHLTRKKSPVRSCGCSRFISGEAHRDWKGHKGISGDWWYNHVLRERKQRTRKTIPVTVTKEEAWDLYLKQDMKCALSGLDIEINNNSINNTASIDRIDSSKGYEIDNIQWVHKDVNFMKRTYSQEYFIEMCKKIAKSNSSSQ